MSAIAVLRARTAAAHDRVDTAFSDYDLADRAHYGAFLTAHARALPAAEAFIARHPALPRSRPRTTLLAEDLAALDLALPAPLASLEGDCAPYAWGVQYVVEGSRIGGSLLARRVAPGLPVAYLGARHEPGEWRAFGHALDAEAARYDSDWIDAAASGAAACFDLYARAGGRG